MSTEIKYTILKKDKDINKATLRKYGLHADVTIFDIAQSLRQYGKMKQDFQGNIALTKALLDNVERNYPIVKKLKEDELKAITLFVTKTEELKNFEIDLKATKTNIKTFTDEVALLKKQIGVSGETEADVAIKEVEAIKDVAGATLKKVLKTRNG